MFPSTIRGILLLLFTTSAVAPMLQAHSWPVAGIPQNQTEREALRQHILDDFTKSNAGRRFQSGAPHSVAPPLLARPVKVASTTDTLSMLRMAVMASLSPSINPAPGNGALMAASFGAFKPYVRYYSDSLSGCLQSDNGMSAYNIWMPNRMVGITAWQQQIPLPVSYFAGTTNPESGTGSLAFNKPNVWKLPLVPTAAATPTLITVNIANCSTTSGNPTVTCTSTAALYASMLLINTGLNGQINIASVTDATHFVMTSNATTTTTGQSFIGTGFTRGAIAVAANGIAIFNPHNNTGKLSYEIGELDIYGGHCGLADDYHYHIIPTHLSSLFGGPLGNSVPVAWSLDGYPIYGYLEPDGSAQQPLDSNGGHDIGNGWGYHYHAPGTTTVDASHPYGTPAAPYTQTGFHGKVVDYVDSSGTGTADGQPEVGSIRRSGTGGYTASVVSGASIVGFFNPVALTTDGSGNLMQNSSGTASPDQYIMRVSVSGTTYDECWQINRNVNPPTVTVTWRLPGATTTTTYANVNNRLTPYPMAAWSINKLPDTSQTLNVSTAPQNQDSNYTVNPQSFTDNADGTITDNVTGLMWQKVDNGESVWSAAVNNAPVINTGGYTDWRLPTPAELQSIQNYNNNQPALNTTYFTSAPVTLTGCSTTNGSTTVTCASTAQLSTAMAITGTNMPTGAKINAITSGTTFTLNTAATGTGSSLTLAAQGGDYWWTSDPYFGSTTNIWCVNAGGGVGPKPLTETLSNTITLTNCTTNGTTTVTCASTSGLLAGGSISGTNIPGGTLISSVTNSTTFVISQAASGSGSSLTLTAHGAFRYCARYVRGKKPTNAHNYVNNNDGTVTDTDTGLMWTQAPFTASSWNSALSTAAGTTTGGYADWRLPNVKEMGTLTDYTLTSATSSTGIQPSINRQMFGVTLANCATTSGSTTVTCASTTGLLVGMPLVDYTDVSGTYINGTTAPTITAVSSSTSFTISSAAAGTGSGLTLSALPPPTAYWTSSVVASGTITQAWLVETGINNSVPAQNGPTRNSQGIISYEAFASSYPFFAVRNTTVATQITVTQNGNMLTDGVSSVGYTAAGSKTFTITNSGATSLTLSGITIDGTNASNFSLVNAPANPTTLAASGSATFSVQFTAANAGNYSAALHIASTDPAISGTFDVTLTGNIAVIDSVATNPAVPSAGDSPYVTAKITPASGKTISQVQLSYSAGTGSSATNTVFNETMSGTPTTNGWSGTLASNPWTTVIANGNGNVNQTSAASNHTAPILLGNCTISGSTTVTCSSTAGLWPGMIVTGTGIPAGDTVGAVNSATTFTLASAATNGSGVAVTIAGLTLTNCATNSTTTSVSSTITSTSSPSITVASNAGLAVGNFVTGTGIPNGTYITVISGTTVTLNNNPTATGTPTLTFGGNAVTCTSTTGLVAGMGITGTGIPGNTTVYQVTGATSLLLSAAATATNSGQTFTASGCGLQFNKGSTTAACSATTSNAIDLSGLNNGTTSTSATISFWASASNITAAGVGWSLQLSTDGGTTWPASTSTGAVTEFATANHGFTQYTYTLQQSELTNNVKLRFNFLGNGSGGSGAAKFAMDDITVTKTTTNSPPTFTVTMYDDGTHGDAVAGDGIYTGQVTDGSAEVAGANVNYSIKVIYTDATFTALATPVTYTVTQPLTITTTSPLPNALTSAAYTQSLAAGGGSGSGYAWSVTGGSLPPGITLGTNGTFSGAPTATGTFNFTATVADSAGHTAFRSFTLTASTPPNVVIILTDDQGWGDIGYHTYPGRVHVDTPNMDSFGTSGIRMERFYPTAVCSVTRACLQTGRNTIRTGVNNARGLDLSEHIIPQTFNAAGYQTFITGKWHVGGPENSICYTTVNGQTVRVIQEGEQYRPYNRGWKMHYGEYGVIDAFTHYESSLLNPVTQPTWLRPDWWLNGTQYFDGDPTQNTDAEGHGGYATDLLADKAVSIITNSNGDRDPTKPLLLYLPFSQIHGPVSAPPSYLAKYGNSSDPTHYISDVPTRTIAASVDCMDVAIGRVLASLDTMGMTNNTLVIFMSDNGGENATGGSDLPLRGAKTEPYDGGLRTPAGIRFPGKLTGGLQVTNCTVSGNIVTCSSTTGLYAGMALTSLPASGLLNWGTTVASVTDATHFTLTSSDPAPQQAITTPITLTAGVVSNQFLWVGDIFPTICAAAGVTPLNTKPFDGLNMWPAWQSISGANPDGTQTRFQTNPDGSKNTTTTNISPLVTLATPNVAYNTYTDPVSGQTKVFKDIYSPNTNAVILTNCTTVANNTTVTCDSTAGLTTGGNIYGVGIKGSATVVSITDATHFVMSDPPNVAYPNATYTNPITLNVGFTTNQLFNIQDDPYETTDYLLSVNQTALALTPAQITQFNAIASAMQTSISINPIVYPPYIGPTLITNTATQGSSIQLYVPFTSYAKNPPLIHWRKNGVNLSDGASGTGSTISGSTTFTSNTTAPDTGYGTASVPTNGAYNTILTVSNVTTGDAGSYDLVVSNVDTYQTPNVTNTVYSPAGTLTVVVGAPVLATEPAYTKGTSNTVSWSAITNATSYTVQAASDVNFTNIIATQTVSTTNATFNGLSSGMQYWFRATATDGVTTSDYSNVVTSTQDAGNPVVTITSPANGSIATQPTITVTGTSSDATSGVASITVNGVAAATSDNFAHWSATVPLAVGGNTITATALDNAQPGGNQGTASVTVTLSPTAPVISSVSTGPTSPTYLDPVTVFSNVQPGTGASITQVQLSYTTGAPVISKVFREVFSNTSTNNWDGTTTLGSLNPWTKTAVRNAGDVRQAVGSANNNTTPILLTSCATTGGSTTVTCASTASLWPGMMITGTNIAASTKVASVINATTFVLSANATGTGSSLTLTAAGATLTNCTTTTGSTTVTCDSTTGLIVGMGLSGSGLAGNSLVSSITNSSTFVMSASPTTPGTGLTLTASGAGAELLNGTVNLTDTMIATTNAINLTGGSAGYVEFYLATTSLAATNNCQWAFQVSPDGGTSWNTRLSENWNAQTVNLGGCVLNTTGGTGGSTTVTCTSTSGLTAGQAVAGPNIYITGNVTNGSAAVTNTNTASLAVGMFISGAGGGGIPNNARVLSIDSVTQFTMSTNATATGTAASLAATCFASNTTVSSVTNSTTFVLNTPAYVNTTSSPVSATATTANHGFQLYHYDLAAGELTSNVKLRFQYAGYVPTAPTKAPNVDIDDIIVVKTTPAPPTLVTMYDDGQHGDGAAGDGIYAAQIPIEAGGTTVNFMITATDSNNATTTGPASGSYTYTVSSALTDAVIVNSEHLSVPTDTSVTLNAVASSAQDAFVEYGTASGAHTSATTPATFSTPGVNGVYPIAVTLTGLQPNTKYYYRLRQRVSGSGYYNARGERSFHTARPRGSSFVFTIFADPHLDVNTYNDPNDATHAPQLLNKALANVATDQPDFHIDLGDILMTDKMQLTDGTGIPSYWGGSVFPNQSLVSARASILRGYYQQTTHSVPFLGTLGNHEAEYGYLFNAASDPLNNIPAWDLTARRTYFPEPVPGTFYGGNNNPVNYTGGTLGLPQNYYAWEWGDALFIVLDPYWNTTTNPTSTQNAWNWSLGQTQYNWLKTTLQNSSASYKFVFMHHLIGGSWTLTDVTLANCSLASGTTISCTSTTGLNVGALISGTGLATNPPNQIPLVTSVSPTQFTVSVGSGGTITNCPATLSGGATSNCAARGGVEVAPYFEWGGKNTDGSYGFTSNRPGWDMPIHNLLVQNNVNVVFHGHDHLYGYQTLDGIVYLECPQPGTRNYTQLGSATDGKYSSGTLLPNSGHIRVTVGPAQTLAEYVRAYLPADENATTHNRDVSHSFTLSPTVFPPIEMMSVSPGAASFRFNAVANKPYSVQWSTDLINWTTIDTMTFTQTNTNASYTDTNTARTGGTKAFYRVSYNP